MLHHEVRQQRARALTFLWVSPQFCWNIIGTTHQLFRLLSRKVRQEVEEGFFLLFEECLCLSEVVMFYKCESRFVLCFYPLIDARSYASILILIDVRSYVSLLILENWRTLIRKNTTRTKAFWMLTCKCNYSGVRLHAWCSFCRSHPPSTVTHNIWIILIWSASLQVNLEVDQQIG